MDLLKVFAEKRKKLALLIDPEKTSVEEAKRIAKSAQENNFSFIFIGGSLVSDDISIFVSQIKKSCSLLVFIFPGSAFQISEKADGILLLSLISGRNPDYLIGQHVLAAPFLKKSKVKIISTGYILLESGNTTSVEYMSNTKPIPQSKTDIICATAMAGEMLGLKLIYLEAGSGAQNPIDSKVISEVRKSVSIPIIAGGGIRTTGQLKNVFKAGADIAVIGTAIEENPSLLKQFGKIVS